MPLRDFGLGAQVLAHLGVGQVRLLTNKPRRIAGMEGYGLHLVECVPSGPPAVVVPLRDSRVDAPDQPVSTSTTTAAATERKGNPRG